MPVVYRKRDEVEKAAAEVLQRHGITSIPVDPVLIANLEGIRVRNAKFNDNSISGMIAKSASGTALVVNNDDPPNRKRFTIAHELGHHFLHLQDANEGDFVDTLVDLYRAEASDEPKLEEVQANQFAAALLMPRESIKRAWDFQPNVEVMSRYFIVSDEAMAIRLNQLGLA